MSENRKSFTADQARTIGEEIGIGWATAPLDIESGPTWTSSSNTDCMTYSPTSPTHVTAKIALAHLNEFPDYYTRLEHMEEQAKHDWAERSSD